MFKTTFTCLALALYTVCWAQSELLQKYIEVQHERLGFNGTVLVTKNNETLYRVSIGKASQELQVPINSGSVFRIASITKQFTATLVALAIQEKKLKLTDSLVVFFPQLKDSHYRKINIHQLLTHTSGIPHNEGITDYWALKSRLPLSKQEALAEILSMKLLFEPGMDMKYSSPGYFLLACILESIYERPYDSILHEKILEPLKMEHTGVYVTGKLFPGMVSGYHLLSDSLITAPFREFALMKGSGDLFSNADDLAKWNNSLSANGIWNKSLQMLLFTIHTQKPPYYGYGWYIRPGKRPAYYHGGGTFGSSTFSVWYPDEVVSVIILSNVSVLPVTEIWNDIEKIIFNEPFEIPAIRAEIQVQGSELQLYTGAYARQNQQLTIMSNNDRLFAKLGSNPPFEIYAESKFKFYGKKVNVRFTFMRDDDGNITGLEAETGGETLQFNRK